MGQLWHCSKGHPIRDAAVACEICVTEVATLIGRPSGETEVPTLIGRPARPEFGFDVEASRTDELTRTRPPSATAVLEVRYHILAKVADGGMGSVLLAQERSSGRVVAIKVMHPDAAADRSMTQQFIREAVVTARLQHPGIIPIYELGFLTGPDLYYTMRFVEGCPLSKLLRERVLALPERLHVLRQAALAVDHAHGEGLWHRDLKPQNILVGKHGEVYVIDWGLVTVQRGRRYSLKLPALDLGYRNLSMDLGLAGMDALFEQTREAVTAASRLFAGTPAYMSPEQLNADDTAMGAISDVWAFGVMLYEALAGRHPFDNGQSDAVLPTLREAHPDLRRVVPEVDPRLIALCDKMLEKQPSQRLPSLGAFVMALDAMGRSTARIISTLPSSFANDQRAIVDALAENLALSKENEILNAIARLGPLSWRQRRRLRSQLEQVRSRAPS